jgi:hypothetical protein
VLVFLLVVVVVVARADVARRRRCRVFEAFFTAVVRAVVEPAVTRLVCRARWRTAFFGAASTADAMASRATKVSSIDLKLLRFIGSSSTGEM